MRDRIYVGCRAGSREVFKSGFEPSSFSHGDKYNAVIGPFRTMRGAKFMAERGANNPHVQDVRDAERIAKQLADNEKTMNDFTVT